MESEVIDVKNGRAVKKRGSPEGFEGRPTSGVSVEGASGWALHTESCPDGCFTFVSRYLVKTQTEAEPSTADCDRSAAGSLRAA